MTDTNKFYLCTCPKCGRVFMQFLSEPIPERCRAEKRGYSYTGVIGEYTSHCQGVPFIIPVLGYLEDGKPRPIMAP